MKKIKLLLLAFFATTMLAVAQTDTTALTEDMFQTEVKTSQEINSENVSQPDKNLISELTPLSSYEFYLSLLVMGFGAFALLLEVWLIHKKRISQDNMVKFIVVTLIITATLFLITAGYDNNQIAPAMGLLGTIAGYLMGKNADKEDDDTKK